MIKRKLVIFVIALGLLSSPLFSYAQQVINVKADPIVYNTKLSLAPTTMSVVEGSTFDISVLLDTNKHSINTIDLNLKFSPNTLAIVDPAAGNRSLIAVWLQPPTFSNTNGTANYAGIIPNGVTTDQGVVVTITFKAKKSGVATVEVAPASHVLLNDGLGSETLIGFGKARYSIVPLPPAGVTVFSDTHPFVDKWYNNNSPSFTWEKIEGVTDFSFEMDAKPFTIPDNNPETIEAYTAFENLPDGLQYFHIKSRKSGIWGTTTHFPIRIDTSPPAQFKPVIELLNAGNDTKLLVSFFTTDGLSGIDHYEVGVVDINKSSLETPTFVQTESPYQLPVIGDHAVRVFVRAMDMAGNVIDGTADIAVNVSSPWYIWFQNNRLTILFLLLLLFVILLLMHFLYGHRIIPHIKTALKLFKKIEKQEHEAEDLIHHDENKNNNPPPSLPPSQPSLQ